MEEKKECKCKCINYKKIIYWVIVVVGVSFIVYTSIGIGNRLVSNNCDCPSNNSEDKIKDAEKERYEFDFYDGGIPGSTYIGFINLKNGYVKISKEQKCSVKGGCVKSNAEIIEGSLTVTELNKVITYLEKINYKELKSSISDENTDNKQEMTNFINYVIWAVEGKKNTSLANDGLDSLIK